MSDPRISAVRIVNDSLRVVLSQPPALIRSPAPLVTVLREHPVWWNTALFQAFLGGILAAGAGLLAEAVRAHRDQKEKGELMRAIVLEEFDTMLALLPQLIPHVANGRQLSVALLIPLDESRRSYREGAHNIIYLRPKGVRPKVNSWFREFSAARPSLDHFLASPNPQAAQLRQQLAAQVAAELQTLVNAIVIIGRELGLEFSLNPAVPHRAIPKKPTWWRRLLTIGR